MRTEYIKITRTSTAATGMTGALSAAEMRTLLKATGEIEPMAVTTKSHLKVLTGRSGGCKYLLESVMGSFEGRLTGKCVSRGTFGPPSSQLQGSLE